MNIYSPKPLNVNSSEMTRKWNLWHIQFQWYAIETNLKTNSMEKQVAIFMTVIGDDAIELFESFDVDDESLDLKSII